MHSSVTSALSSSGRSARNVSSSADASADPRRAALADGVRSSDLATCGKGAKLINRPEVEIAGDQRSEEHTSELQSPCNLVCRLLLEKKKTHHEIERPFRRDTDARQVC